MKHAASSSDFSLLERNTRFWNTQRKPECIFLIIATLVGVLLVFLAPVAAGPDEPTHLYRIEQIARGQQPQTVTESWDTVKLTTGFKRTDADKNKSLTSAGGYIDSGYKQAVSSTYSRVRFHEVFSWPAWQDPHVSTTTRSGHDVPTIFTNTTGNSPLVYAPQILGYWLGRLLTPTVYQQVIVMRLCGLLAYIVGIFFAIRIIPFGKWLMLAIGLLPNSLIVNSCVTADTMTMIICLLFVAKLMQLLYADSPIGTRKLIPMGILCIAIGFVKMTYFPLILLSGLLILLRPELRKRKPLAVICGFAMAGFLCFLICYNAATGFNSGLMFGKVTDPDAQKTFIITHPIAYLKTVFMLMLQQDILNISSLSPIIDGHSIRTTGWFTAIGLLCAVFFQNPTEKHSSVKGSVWVISSMWGVFLIGVALICTALYMYWDVPGNPQSTGVQARYFLPILPLLLLPIKMLFAEAQPSGEPTTRLSAARAFITICIVFSLFVMLLNVCFHYYGWHPLFFL